MTYRSQPKPGRYLTFLIKGQTFGAAVDGVREINRYRGIRPVPQAPAFVAGMIYIHGHAIPVVDLRLKFGFEAGGVTKDTCMIVFEGHGFVSAAIVDAVRSVIILEGKHIEPNLCDGGSDRPSYVLGMGTFEQTRVILVDPIRSLVNDNLDSFLHEHVDVRKPTRNLP